MAENRTDSNVYTIIFAIVMVVVVGALLAFVASSLNPTIKENQKFEAQQNILYAMGENENEDPYAGTGSVQFIPTADVEEVFKTHIVKQLVFQGDEVREDPEAYLIDLKREEQLAKDPNYHRQLPLFIAERDGKTYYVIPMRGKGLWDAIWGYMAFDKDLKIEGTYFDHAGETPGLGANIKERFFMDDFHGERVLDENNNVMGVTIAKGNMDPLNERKDDYKIDAIAGATITGNGVTSMINQALDMYAPYLLKLSKEN